MSNAIISRRVIALLESLLANTIVFPKSLPGKSEAFPSIPTCTYKQTQQKILNFSACSAPNKPVWRWSSNYPSFDLLVHIWCSQQMSLSSCCGRYMNDAAYQWHSAYLIQSWPATILYKCFLSILTKLFSSMSKFEHNVLHDQLHTDLYMAISSTDMNILQAQFCVCQPPTMDIIKLPPQSPNNKETKNKM